MEEEEQGVRIWNSTVKEKSMISQVPQNCSVFNCAKVEAKADIHLTGMLSAREKCNLGFTQFTHCWASSPKERKSLIVITYQCPLECWGFVHYFISAHSNSFSFPQCQIPTFLTASYTNAQGTLWRLFVT